MNNIIGLDIKRDSVFKNVYLREAGRIHMCSIISNLYNLNYNDLVKKLRMYNGEHPRLNNYNSSYNDIVYEYKNKLFIIEMNKSYYEKIIFKNYFYLFFRHIFDANNKNGYNMYKETYLIEFDNYDINKKLNNNCKSYFITNGEVVYKENNTCIYNNIKTTRINLDYLKKIKYNYNRLTNIERDCLIFVENNKEKLKKYGNYKNIEGVIKLLEVIEINGKYYPKFDKEEWEESLRQEMKERGLKEGIAEGLRKGIKEGKKEGYQLACINLAKKLLSKNFNQEIIEELTGIPKNELKKLNENFKITKQ